MPKLSVVIPTFNEEKNLFFRKTLENLAGFEETEVICVDRESSDKTAQLVEQKGWTLLPSSENSRAERLNLGIEKAKSDFILLNHPRSTVDPAGIQYLLDHRQELAWGGFRHSFDKKHPLLEFTSWYSNNVRGKHRGIVFLDHCIFFWRHLLNQKIPKVDIFEDTEISKILLWSQPPVILDFPATTSAERFYKNGVLKQGLLNQGLKMGYYLGISDEKMNRFYEKGLSLNSVYKQSKK